MGWIAVLPRYDRHSGNCVDGDSIHGSPVGAVTELCVKPRGSTTRECENAIKTVI